MAALHELSLAQASEGIRTGVISPVEMAEACLGRIDTLDSVMKAWVTVDHKGVLGQAQRAQDEIKKGGPRSPLHGIPVGIKDIIYTKGMKTTGGSKTLSDFFPDFDATVVARLKGAGAVILGKNTTCEFAASGSPLATNPWNHKHTTSGSSTGSASAVASRMCPASLGSQTGGSTLRPASFCGVVGLKPSYGRISRYGVMAFSYSVDTVGIIVRSVDDAALVLQAIAGYDRKDPGSMRRSVPDYLRGAKNADRPPRIGLVRHYFDLSEPETRVHTESVVARFEAAGAQVEEAEVPESFSLIARVQPIITAVEGAAYHQKGFPGHEEEFTPGLRRTIESGSLISAVDYLQAQRIRRQIRREMEAVVKRYDVFFTPTVATPAPLLDAPPGAAGNEFQLAWTALGFPSITLPSGLAPTGLPWGVQLVAAPFAEGALLGAARWCERVLGVSLTPPGI